jgi:hypothetical protein
MSGPSSTSSSEPGAAAALRRTLAWCLLFLACARLALAVLGPGWTQRPDLANVAAYLRSGDDRDVQVIAFGSSTMMGAFDAEAWQRRAGLPPGAVVNAAVANGTFFDVLYLLREAGGPPSASHLVLVEVPRWNFNRNRLSPVSGEPSSPPRQIRQLGTLGDRLAVDAPAARARLVAEYAWPLYQRRPLEAWLRQWREPFEPTPAPPPPSRHWNPKHQRALAADPTFRAESIARYHFHDAAWSDFAGRNLLLVLARLREAGVRVVLVQTPVRDAYLRVAKASPETRRLYEEVGSFVAAEAGDGVTLAQCERGRDCGLSDRVFVDYGHMTRPGARDFTRWLQRRVAADERG